MQKLVISHEIWVLSVHFGTYISFALGKQTTEYFLSMFDTSALKLITNDISI